MLFQGFEGGLPRCCSAFGSNGAVKFIFNLQQIGRQLLIIALRIFQADFFVRLIGRLQGAPKGLTVLADIVVANNQRALSITLIAEVAHPQ